MSVSHLLAAALLEVPSGATSAYALSTGRLWSLVGGGVGLAGVVAGGLALARAAGRLGTGNGRTAAIVALAAGVIGAVVGALVVAAADGGPGTGYGIVGGYVALVIGLVAIALGGLVLARSRRTV